MPENIVLDRPTRLAAFNRQLAERHLKPLPAIGDCMRHQIELVSLKEIIDRSQDWFTDVVFDCLYPDGEEGEYTLRFDANGDVVEGQVVIVQIGTKFAIVRQYRPAFGAWRNEFVRTFADVEAITGVDDLPIGADLHQIDEEIGLEAEIDEIVHLGKLAENSSTSTAEPDYWLVRVSVNDAELEQRLAKTNHTEEGLGLQLWTWEAIQNAVGGQLRDNHTLAAIALFEAMNRRTPETAKA